MKNKLILVVSSIFFLLTGCFNVDEEKLKVKELINPFYETLLFEDIDKTMFYFNENSNGYFDIYQNFLESFNNYDLHYIGEGISFDIVSKELIEAKVKVNISGISNEGEKIDKTIIHIFKFKKDSEGLWKIVSLEEIPIN